MYAQECPEVPRKKKEKKSCSTNIGQVGWGLNQAKLSKGMEMENCVITFFSLSRNSLVYYSMSREHGGVST